MIHMHQLFSGTWNTVHLLSSAAGVMVGIIGFFMGAVKLRSCGDNEIGSIIMATSLLLFLHFLIELQYIYRGQRGHTVYYIFMGVFIFGLNVWANAEIAEVKKAECSTDLYNYGLFMVITTYIVLAALLGLLVYRGITYVNELKSGQYRMVQPKNGESVLEQIAKLTQTLEARKV